MSQTVSPIINLAPCLTIERPSFDESVAAPELSGAPDFTEDTLADAPLGAMLAVQEGGGGPDTEPEPEPKPEPEPELLERMDGNDVLFGDAQINQRIIGGAGEDTFVFRLGDGQNVVEKFDIAQDRIALDDLDEVDLTLNDYGSGSALVAADGTEFWFIGMTGASRSDLSFINYDQIV